MKVLVAGSRSINNFDLSEYIPNETELIISGGASGIDKIAEEYADKRRLSKLVLRPKYERYGKGAPIKRNEEMVNMADFVLVIWDGKSKGSKNTIELAQRYNKEIKVVVVTNKT